MRQQMITYALLGALFAALGQVSFKLGAAGRMGVTEYVNGWILAGLLLYLAGTVLWILALSTVPLTVLYAFTALTYVLVNVFAVIFLGEQLTLRGLAGTALVLFGLFMVATSFEVNRHGIQ